MYNLIINCNLNDIRLDVCFYYLAVIVKFIVHILWLILVIQDVDFCY
jgi:hypothetical protein